MCLLENFKSGVLGLGLEPGLWGFKKLADHIPFKTGAQHTPATAPPSLFYFHSLLLHVLALSFLG